MTNQRTGQKGNGKETTFLLNLVTQYVNAGDFSINRLLVEMLSSYGKVRVHLGGAPEAFSMKWLQCFESNPFVDSQNNIGSDALWREFENEQSKRGRCVAVMPAGGYPLPNNLRWVVRYIRIYSRFASLRRRNVEILWAGSSFSVPPTKLRWFGLAALNQVQHLGVRDVRVVKQLQSFGLKHASYFPDWTLVGGRLEPAGSKGLSKDKPKVVVISFRREHDENAESLRDFINALSKRCQTEKQELVVLNQVAGDDQFIRGLLDQSETSPIVQFVSGVSDEADSRAFLRNADLVVSNRLHVCLFAITEGTPAIALAGTNYMEKILGVIHSAKMPCPHYPLHEWRKVLDVGSGVGYSDWLKTTKRAMAASAAEGEFWMTSHFGQPVRPLASSLRENHSASIGMKTPEILRRTS